MLKLFIYLQPMTRHTTSTPVFKHKLITLLFVGVSFAAFATLGDGGKRNSVRTRSMLSTPSVPVNFKTFSLKSGYNYRGNMLFKTENTSHFVLLNTVMTYQKGNATYIIPLKKKLLLGKVSFQPVAPR